MKLNKFLNVTVLVLVLTLTALFALPVLAGLDIGCCEGGVTKLTLKYLGASTGLEVRVEGKDAGTVFDGTVANPGDTFSFGTSGVKLGTETKIYVGDPEVLHCTFHTSCSQPIYKGVVVCDAPHQFEVVDGESKDYPGPLCEPKCDPKPSGGDDVKIDNKNVEWEITNNMPSDALVINRIELTWPTGNGNLKKVKLGRDTIFEQERAPTYTEIDSGWKGDLKHRAIDKGKTEKLKFEFQNNAVEPTTAEPLCILVEFLGENCVEDNCWAPPTVITLCSFGAKSSAGGSASPPWLGLAGLTTVLAAGSLFWAKRRIG